MAAAKYEIESRRKDEPQIGRDDDWDDSALIAAYDKAMNKAKVEVAKKKNIPYDAAAKNYQKSKKKSKWNVGDHCRATFSADGLNYEAVISEIDESRDSCIVHFIGYGNEEDVPLSSLTPSMGKPQREKQEQMAKAGEENDDCDDAESSSLSEEENVRRRKGGESSKSAIQDDVRLQKEAAPFHRCYADGHAPYYMGPVMACPPPPPPPSMPTPPPFLMDRTGPEDEKLYAMLLSWYMSGYHTGYYMGSRQPQQSPSHLRNPYNYYGH